MIAYIMKSRIIGISNLNPQSVLLSHYHLKVLAPLNILLSHLVISCQTSCNYVPLVLLQILKASSSTPMSRVQSIYCAKCRLVVKPILFLSDSAWQNKLRVCLYVCLGDHETAEPRDVYVCLCDHETAEVLDDVAELPDTQVLQQTDVNENYRDRQKGMQILLSRTQAEQLSKIRKKFLATTYELLADLCIVNAALIWGPSRLDFYSNLTTNLLSRKKFSEGE